MLGIHDLVLPPAFLKDYVLKAMQVLNELQEKEVELDRMVMVESEDVIKSILILFQVLTL
jgi:hypothetical protein